jgi:3-phosphoshikimate 1-carboxyvinyltransferase
MLAAIADGTSTIHNYSTGADCQSTLNCVGALGIQVDRRDGTVEIRGQSSRGLKPPVDGLDAGNSGSTIRMLSGILAAQPFRTTISGDESLSRRPMERIMAPLSQMGATVEAREGKFPPITIHGSDLRPIDYSLPVASAQVKTCVLFAGLYANGATTVRESVVTRDHTEIALRELGAPITIRRGVVTVQGPAVLQPRDLMVPGDLSSAAFFLVAAMLLPGSDLSLQGVGLNPTRSSLIDFLVSLGGSIQVTDVQQTAGELIGNLRIRSGRITGGIIEKSLTAALIDEIPVLAVLGAKSEQGLSVRDAAELRIKETDRIAAVAENFRRMGVSMEVLPDGFNIPGNQRFGGAELDSFGDHRIAMAFSIAALAAGSECVIRNAEAAAVSYPEFFAALRSIAA